MVAIVGFLSQGAGYGQALGRVGDGGVGNLAGEQAPAAASRVITGTVFDPSGAAIAQARVSLLGSDDKALAAATTDTAGGFHFENLAPGNYTLDFHAEGFRDIRIHASVTVKRQSPIRVVMQILVPTENVTVA